MMNNSSDAGGAKIEEGLACVNECVMNGCSLNVSW
jgi:hypothetical protein